MAQVDHTCKYRETALLLMNGRQYIPTYIDAPLRRLWALLGTSTQLERYNSVYLQVPLILCHLIFSIFLYGYPQITEN